MNENETVDPKTYTEAKWRTLLNPMEYHVLREAGTELPGSGTLIEEDRPGTYYCRACGAKLFRSDAKFASGCGWPAFFAAEEGATYQIEDHSHGMHRIEVRCSNCESHLGHIFDDAPQTPTGQRYCMNSICLTFEPDPA
ncbi:peptide-methionine (R)-S-oxide reductase [Boudabousia liubingyangii]|uniref:peptide-methionine (R)-S-oxide reductase n=1 Tax=Boudabousia liubingyangii TaxID=1921764 RepID=A0A1Q5PK17_9ACTO|nr:peptide-methionine (R)-S-oxide reductase MsrB [Boudabousia liubingyangii]OKL46566.1 peptide-methionine (R)-S-oxide reductase [Boudabousia liubingyangii]OKL46849.1 peptide-methionine (R)-S-oxide reductase [Boudabousia liubingyangii]